MTPMDREATVLETIALRLKAEGYEVFIHPSEQMLPPFMGRYIPDAVALKADRRLAIEIVREGVSSDSQLDRIRTLFEKETGWELLVYWVSGSTVEPDITSPEPKSVQTSIDQIESLLEQGFLVSALLQAWATFEAAARFVSPDRFSRPQSPRDLIEALASEGIVTPSEADTLRSASQTRNIVAHGDLRAIVAPEQVRALLAVTRAMILETREAS